MPVLNRNAHIICSCCMCTSVMCACCACCSNCAGGVCMGC